MNRKIITFVPKGSPLMKSVELLAPAKDFQHGQAAVDCGADALYVGAPCFGARVDAAVSIDQIEALCTYGHRFGVKVFVAMNTLLFENELREAERWVHQIYHAGADALIIQDTAFLRMDLPPIELHASTQMFNLEPERIKFWAQAGFSRIILERAVSLAQIRTIAGEIPQTQIEAFVHGAICVGYSGRCYMSRSLSSRSGNRGACIQACRLPFSLKDDAGNLLLKEKHLMSLYDLNLTGHLEQMIDAGVSSFKIEGRLKDLLYVRNVTGWYRRRLDEILNRRDDLCRSSAGESVLDFTPDPQKSFSRGATSYYISGMCSGAASFHTPKSFGERLGTVTRISRDSFTLSDHTVLSPGDGICFAGKNESWTGTQICRVTSSEIYPNSMANIFCGTEIFRNHNHQFVAQVSRTRTRRRICVKATLVITAEESSLQLEATGVTVCVRRQSSSETAREPRQAEQNIRSQLSKSGDTPYRIDRIDIRWDVPRFIPLSLLNALRRDALDQLDRERLARYVRTERCPENKQAPLPEIRIGPEENVVNSLSERFYRDHGAQSIQTGYDLHDDLTGAEVMRTAYCLRRETDQCLKKKTSCPGRLFLETRGHRYELLFDCVKCQMKVIDRGFIQQIPNRNNHVLQKNKSDTK